MMKKWWSEEEDKIIIDGVRAGLKSRQIADKLPTRSHNAVRGRALRLDYVLGSGHVPGTHAAKLERDRQRAHQRPARRDPEATRHSTWDDKLFEPWAERKARRERERAKAQRASVPA